MQRGEKGATPPNPGAVAACPRGLRDEGPESRAVSQLLASLQKRHHSRIQKHYYLGGGPQGQPRTLTHGW